MARQRAAIGRGRWAGLPVGMAAVAAAVMLAVAAAMLAAALPGPALAQNQPPHVFIGIATLNGAVPAIGTEVTAHDAGPAGGSNVGSTVTGAGGKFILQVSRAGGTVTFEVGGVPAAQTLPAGGWESGMIESDFNLTASASTRVCPAAPGQISGATTIATFHSHEMPHVFVGQARIAGQPAAAGAAITAWDGATLIGRATTRAGGRYSIPTARAYGPITFKVNGRAAAQSHTPWTMGQITAGFNLSAAGAMDCLQGTLPVQTVIDAVGGKILRVFAFDNDVKRWIFYDPQIPQHGDLTEMTPGQPYYILVSESFQVMVNGNNRRLTCSGGSCWNLITW